MSNLVLPEAKTIKDGLTDIPEVPYMRCEYCVEPDSDCWACEAEARYEAYVTERSATVRLA